MMTIIEYFNKLYAEECEYTHTPLGAIELEQLVFTWRTTKKYSHIFYAWVEATKIDIDTKKGSDAVEAWINKLGGHITPNGLGFIN